MVKVDKLVSINSVVRDCRNSNSRSGIQIFLIASKVRRSNIKPGPEVFKEGNDAVADASNADSAGFSSDCGRGWIRE